MSFRSTGLDDKPIKGLDLPVSSENEPPTSPIPRREKPAVEPAQINGHAVNGKKEALDKPVDSASKKRTVSQALEDESGPTKRIKHDSYGRGITANGDLVIIEDDDAILIDD
jgi:hypothetical protein